MSALTDVFTDIANSIRSKLGTADTFKPTQMADAINNISGGGGGTVTEYRIVTKSTGSLGSITVNKFENGSLVSSTDYSIPELQVSPVNVDGFFTLTYSGTSYKYTLLKDSTTHSTGYLYEWGFNTTVNFSDVFVEGDAPVVITSSHDTVPHAFNKPVLISDGVTTAQNLLRDFTAFNQPVNFPDSVTSMANALIGCSHFNQPVTLPANLTSMHQAFYGCFNFNQPVNFSKANVLTDMRAAFWNCQNFNQPVNIPNNVSLLSQTFAYCYNFNQPVTFPDSLTNLYQAFYGCNNFNQPVVINSPNRVHLLGAFTSCYNFNSPITIRNAQYLKVDGLQNFNAPITITEDFTSLEQMCMNCSNFNAPVTLPATTSSPTSTTMMYTFNNCRNFNQPINLPSTLASLQYTFCNCTNFNQPINIPENVSAIMGAFSGCANFNQTVDLPTNAVNFMRTFEHCGNLNSPINIDVANTSKVTDLSYMFYNCGNFNQSISIPNNVLRLDHMFRECVNFNSPIIIPNKVNNCCNMFQNTKFNQPLEIPVTVQNMFCMFYGDYDFENVLTIHENASRQDYSSMFSYNSTKPNLRKEIHMGVGGSMTKILAAAIVADGVGRKPDWTTNSVCAWNEKYNIYIYNDR